MSDSTYTIRQWNILKDGELVHNTGIVDNFTEEEVTAVILPNVKRQHGNGEYTIHFRDITHTYSPWRILNT